MNVGHSFMQIALGIVKYFGLKHSYLISATKEENYRPVSSCLIPDNNKRYIGLDTQLILVPLRGIYSYVLQLPDLDI